MKTGKPKKLDTSKSAFRISWRPGSRFTAFELTNIVLSGSDYDRGSVETAHAQAVNTTEALGRLLMLLHDKGRLTSQEICDVLGNGEPVDG